MLPIFLPFRMTGMSNPDLLLYVAHVAFWASFGITRVLVRTPAATPTASEAPPVADHEQTAPFSRFLLFFH